MRISRETHDVAAQVLLVVLLSALVAVFLGHVAARSPLNLLPIFVLPAAIGLVVNEGIARKLLMATILVAISVVCVSVVSVCAGYF
jgi:hypothetical protein